MTYGLWRGGSHLWRTPVACSRFHKNRGRICMRRMFWAFLAMAGCAAGCSPALSGAQSCDAATAPGYFKPLTDGDGLRYPIDIGPLSWRLMGDKIQPVKGSDGLTHLAYE